MGGNECPAGISTTAPLGLFTLLYFLKINIWVIFPHTTKKMKETKSNMLQFKFICHSGFSFFAIYIVLLFTRKERTTLKMLNDTKICETIFLAFYEAAKKLF